jgi:hypothetical protein
VSSEIIFLVEESIEGGYEARALGHSIFTGADTVEELREMVRDAIVCHFDEEDRPAVVRLHFVKEELLALFPATAPCASELSITFLKMLRSTWLSLVMSCSSTCLRPGVLVQPGANPPGVFMKS